MNPLDFTALDFETATSEHFSICQVGLVIVKKGIISKKYSTLIKPPNNDFSYYNIKIHNIEPYMTEDAPTFNEVWDEISTYLSNQHIVCHNSSFDLLKLEETLNYYDISIPNYSHSCTFQIFGNKLDECCKNHDIEFHNHHDALADAEACAHLYLKHLENTGMISVHQSNSPFASKRIEKTDLVPDFEIENRNNPFYQKKVVFTGELNSFQRKDAAHRLKLLGADVNTSISKKTNFIIVGSNPGPSKMEKIEKLGIPVLSEDEFIKMIEE